MHTSFLWTSAFNVITLTIWLEKQSKINVNSYVIRWYGIFLTEKQHKVRAYTTVSEVLVCNAGRGTAGVCKFVLALRNIRMTVRVKAQIAIP